MEQNKQVNVVGAGLAGLAAAITLAEQGVKCRLISAQPSERAQSVLAEGGINAALDIMGEGDTWQEHRDDTLRGGADLADPAAVAAYRPVKEMFELCYRSMLPVYTEMARR